MNALIDAALERSRMVLTALALIIVAGITAYIGIPKESDPDIPIPIIYVSMVHEGISPEDAERLLVRPMEQELRSIEGLKEMRSTAADGYANVLMEFEAGFDSKRALEDVRRKVDIAKKELPEDTKDPTVNEVNVALFPVLVVTLSGDVPQRTLVRMARDLRDDLQGLLGVLKVDLAGDREDLLEVVVDPLKLESYNISQQELINAVTLNNQLIAAGALDTGAGRFSVKVPGLYKSARDVLETPIKVKGEGVVTLADVTTVRRTFKDPTTYARVNGKPAIALEVRKRIGENVIDTIEDVKRKVAEVQATWPDGIRVGYSQDKSTHIRTMLVDLQNNVISAILLVMIVVLASLGIRSAGLVGVAIPTSFLLGILTLATLGMTINIVVLFSLILVVGMLVDGAIIVTELADRKMAEGLHRREAYALAAKRMAWPVISSTATTLAAFLPLMFWPGVVGEFMKYLPLTLLTTLTASLAVALIFLPTLGAVFGKPGSGNAATLKALSAAEGGDLRALTGPTGAYARTVSTAIRHPWKIALGTVALLIGVQWYYANHGNGVEFFPEVEPDQALVYVHARGNLSIDEKDVLVREVEARVLQLGDFETVYVRTGARLQGQDAAEDVIGTIQLEFKDWQSRRPAAESLAEIRRRTADLAGITVEPRMQEAGPPTGKAVQVQFSSRHAELLEPAVVKLRGFMDQLAGLTDVEDSRPLPGIEWRLEVDRSKAGRFAADVASIGAVVQLVTNGIKVGEYRPDDADREIDIRVRFPLGDRTIDQLDQLRVRTRDGLIPITNFVTRSAQPKVGTIERVDGRRVMAVKANVAPGVLADDKVKEITVWLKDAGIDERVGWRFKGKDEEQNKAAAFLQKALMVALFLIAIILVTQFNSFYRSFLVLTAVVMSTIGVMLGLIITGQTFSIVMTGIGVIALAGIVVNNNIVLIDTYAHLVRDGMEPMEAIVRTGAQRLRPVMLTTVTTIVGLLPMVFQVNIDFVAREVSVGAPSTQWWVQLSTAVVFGLAFSTVLTLVFTPAMLALGARVQAWRDTRRSRRAAPAPVPMAAD